MNNMRTINDLWFEGDSKGFKNLIVVGLHKMFIFSLKWETTKVVID